MFTRDSFSTNNKVYVRTVIYLRFGDSVVLVVKDGDITIKEK